MIDFEIDGKKLTAPEGTMVIEAADKAGIYIPRFCYHHKLSIAANCRMCLIEVDKMPKQLPACATPVTAGMKVFTRSEKALAAQKSVMEFLLINHPLDCPVCDQGGECELQDLSMNYGSDVSRFTEGKRAVFDPNLGPLIATGMTRCIHCTRCVRFGDEVAGMPELGATDRGEDMAIGTYIEKAVKSEVSGNMIDLCPVGALTSKPFRFQARCWEMSAVPSVARHDCVGSNVYLHLRGKHFSPESRVLRVVPRANEHINEVWLSDRDRFSYEGLFSAERLTTPLIKGEVNWRETDWPTALHYTMNRLKQAMKTAKNQADATQLGALVHPSASLEECFLLQKCLRALGSNNIDHRIGQLDFSDQQQAPICPTLGLSIPELENQNAVLLVGSNIRHEQPLLALRLRKAALADGQIMAVNAMDYDLNFELKHKVITRLDEMVLRCANITKALTALSKKGLPPEEVELLRDLKPTPEEKAIAKALYQGEQSAVILGEVAIHHPDAAKLTLFARLIAKLSQASFGLLTKGANAGGAWLAGAVPHRGVAGSKIDKPGLTAVDMLTKPLNAYILLNIEPELDCSHSAAALTALKQADFVVALSAFRSSALETYADVILPIASLGESAGTYVNVEGRWQSTQAQVMPAGKARPAWKILRVLGNLFELEGFDYTHAKQIHDEVRELCDNIAPLKVAHKLRKSAVPRTEAKETRAAILRFGPMPIYRIDPLVRRAKSLQAMLAGDQVAIRMNLAMARQLKAREGDLVTAIQGQSELTLPVIFDERLPEGQVFIASGLNETAGFGCDMAEVKLKVRS